MLVKIPRSLLGNLKNQDKSDILTVTDDKNTIAVRIGFDGTVYSSGGGSALSVDKITFSDGTVQTSAASDSGTF